MGHTTNSFIVKAEKVHSNRYDYSKVDYKRTDQKVIIICSKHGEFKITPNSHLNGKGCRQCGIEKVANIRRDTQESFIAKAVIVHGDTYSYTNVAYSLSTVNVLVTCKIHGDFSIAPNNLLAGKGCRKCSASRAGTAKRSSQESYIAKVMKVHGGRYDYNTIDYARLNDYIFVGCKTHGNFKVKAGNFANGRGCPNCAEHGYKTDKPAYLYILQNSSITKIGITNRLPKSRAAKISKSYGSKFTVTHQFKFDDGLIPQKLETTLLKELRATYKQPTTVFDGSTECFYDVDIDFLKERINVLISNVV